MLFRSGRLVEDEARESNVLFHLPYERVLTMWRDCVRRTYDPDALFARFVHQLDACYAKRLNPPRQVTARMVRQGLGILARLFTIVGLRSDYRRTFWRFAWPLLKKGDVERVVAVGMVAHHLITFARQAASGRQNASFYSRKLRGDGEAELHQRAA